MKLAGLIYDHSPHFLDHLAPLCSLMGCPLILVEPNLVLLAKKYYPNLEIVEKSFEEVKLPQLTLTCDTQPLLQSAFPNQSTRTIWLPHGRSDKGLSSGFFEALKDESIALIYGSSMLSQIPKTKSHFIGNFRYHYYLKHQDFYHKTIKLPKSAFIYAPSWDDSESRSSFWSSFAPLAKNLPETENLLLKLHPNTSLRYAPEIEIIMGKHGKNNIHFLSEIPPIYPILSQAKAYIGDTSSIGYDFLTFKKPMYFIHSSEKFPLHRCGQAIDPNTFRYAPITSEIKSIQSLYQKTFAKTPNYLSLKEELLCEL